MAEAASQISTSLHADQFLAKAAVKKIKMGDPRDKDVTLGPLASTKQYKRVQEYIKS